MHEHKKNTYAYAYLAAFLTGVQVYVNGYA